MQPHQPYHNTKSIGLNDPVCFRVQPVDEQEYCTSLTMPGRHEANLAGEIKMRAMAANG
jgi:hypothetical protein